MLLSLNNIISKIKSSHTKVNKTNVLKSRGDFNIYYQRYIKLDPCVYILGTRIRKYIEKKNRK